MKDFFELRKQMNEDQFGSFFIKFEGIKNPSKNLTIKKTR